MFASRKTGQAWSYSKILGKFFNFLRMNYTNLKKQMELLLCLDINYLSRNATASSENVSMLSSTDSKLSLDGDFSDTLTSSNF
jgi:hypothetical protein